MPQLKLNLMENAFDFFSEAIDQIDEGSEKLKYSIIHLAAAVELILKTRLSVEHWSLIFKDTNKANRIKFHSGDFQSVSINELVVRLESICCLDLSRHKPIIVSLSNHRNRILHFDISLEENETKAMLVKAWSFIWDFIHDHLSQDLESVNVPLDKIEERMLEHELFIKARRAELVNKMNELKKEGVIVLNCPYCMEENLALEEEDKPTCYFCRHSDCSEIIADDWATVFIGYPHTDPKERMIDPVLKECFKCNTETMIEFPQEGMYSPEPTWVCFYCTESGFTTVCCQKCGEQFIPENWEEENFTCFECQKDEKKKG